ncbi:MAG: sigma-70 family RNA polymerase sigma factor [Saprospiraceae bacterium]|nr:sigma-70 family RNA polymerase sigma factor [Saprospiraceae bacterium]
MDIKELNSIISECKRNNSNAQRQLFRHMYDYGMTIASRYGNTQAESEDIANEGFYKVLKNISKYDLKAPFLAWVRRVIINCAIDHFRKSKKFQVGAAQEYGNTVNEGMSQMESDYLLQMIRSLPPQYKMVFNLHTLEGYSHEEISQKLNISKGTSKSNLSKARKKLQEMVKQHNKIYDHARK